MIRVHWCIYKSLSGTLTKTSLQLSRILNSSKHEVCNNDFSLFRLRSGGHNIARVQNCQ